MRRDRSRSCGFVIPLRQILGAGRFITFGERSNLLRNTILRNHKIVRAQAGNVVAFVIGYGDIQLNHVDHNLNVRLVFLGSA